MKYREKMSNRWHMKWRCRGWLVEFKLLMLTAVLTVWLQDVLHSCFIHLDDQCCEVEVLSEVVLLLVDVNLVV